MERLDLLVQQHSVSWHWVKVILVIGEKRADQLNKRIPFVGIKLSMFESCFWKAIDIFGNIVGVYSLDADYISIFQSNENIEKIIVVNDFEPHKNIMYHRRYSHMVCYKSSIITKLYTNLENLI